MLTLPGPNRDAGVPTDAAIDAPLPDGATPPVDGDAIVATADLETGSWAMVEVVVATDDNAARFMNTGSFGHDPRDGAFGHASGRVRLEVTESALIAFREDDPTPLAVVPILEHFDAIEEADGSFRPLNVRLPWDEHTHVRLDLSATSSSLEFTTPTRLVRGLVALTAPPGSDPSTATPRSRRFTCADASSPDCSPLEVPLVGRLEVGELYGLSGLRAERIASESCTDEGCEGRVWIRTTFLRRGEEDYLPTTQPELASAQVTSLTMSVTDESMPEGDPRRGVGAPTVRHDLFDVWFGRDAEGNPIRDASGAPVRVAPGDRGARRLFWRFGDGLSPHLLRPTLEALASWNHALAGALRAERGEDPARYPAVSCQNTDPNGYCFCADALNPTCPGAYDPLLTPEAAETAGAQNPIRCHIDIDASADPNWEGAVAAADFGAWSGAQLVGDECIFRRLDADADPAYLGTGDPRVLSIGADATERFLGFGDITGDPVTGKARGGSVRLGTGSLDALVDLALRWRDLYVDGTTEGATDIDQPGLVEPPTAAAPAVHAGVVTNANARAAMQSRRAAALARAALLDGPEGRLLSEMRIGRLRDTEIEQELLGLEDAAYFANTEAVGDATEAMIRAGSPIRRPIGERLDAWRSEELDALRAGMLRRSGSDAWDSTLALLAESTSRDGFRFAVSRRIARGAMLFSVGRALGLEPNLAGSSDGANHGDLALATDASIALPASPDPDDRFVDMDVHRRAFDAVLLERERAGAAEAQTSTVLDVSRSAVLPMRSTGRYDSFALAHAYLGLSEIYDNTKDPSGTNRAPLPVADVTPLNTRRVAVRTYRGGESCSAAIVCPYSASGARAAELTAGNTASGLVQSCNGASVCSSFTDDLAAMPEPWLAIEFQSCGLDDRLPRCTLRDHGSSARAVLRDRALRYEQTWVVRTHRLGRASFSPGQHQAELARIFEPTVRIAAGFFQDDLAARDGAFVGYDLGFAVADTANLVSRIVAGPWAADLGDLGTSADRLEPATGALVNLSLPIGTFRPFDSVGDPRSAVGSWPDAVFATEVLTSRDTLGTSASVWDGFAPEVESVIEGGFPTRTGSLLGPWLDCSPGDCEGARVVHRDLFQGNCPGGVAPGDDCLTPELRLLPLTPVSSTLPRIGRWVALLGAVNLATTDSRRPDVRQFVCVSGSVGCPRIPSGLSEGLDFSRVRDHTVTEATYVAFRDSAFVEREPFGLGFETVRHASDDQFLQLATAVYLGDHLPGDPPPSESHLTAEQRGRMAQLGYVLPDDEGVAVRLRDAFGESFEGRARTVEFLAKLHALFGTAAEVAAFVGGACVAAGDDCVDDAGELGVCRSGPLRCEAL